MAVGQSGINKIVNAQMNISTMVRELEDCWNTFNYVTNGLEEWAEETVVGSEVRQNSRILTDLLKETINSINKIQSRVSAFVTEQSRINNG